MDLYAIAKHLNEGLRANSDNISLEECFHLCAKPEYIEELKTTEHQVIWGRRGTGKTTLQKAFVHSINKNSAEPTTVALYVLLSSLVPTKQELLRVFNEANTLAVYIFAKFVNEVCVHLGRIFDERSSILERWEEDKFINNYYDIVQNLSIYCAYLQGMELKIDNSVTVQQGAEHGLDISLSVNQASRFLDSSFSFFKKHNKKIERVTTARMQGNLSFSIETNAITERLIHMLEAIHVRLAYICIDEYSEIDKVSHYSIQSSLAQLIKQVFFKNSFFSVKIATIWNNSQLQRRGGNRGEGIEYRQDIFPGPDLDIMFMDNNDDVSDYFKKLLVNAYMLNESPIINASEFRTLEDVLEKDIFGVRGLRHLICGSQGISRDFVSLVKGYLKDFTNSKIGILRLDAVYNKIINQYLEDVRLKMPYKYSLCTCINKFISTTLSRYFLISSDDYERCKYLIKYLASKGLFFMLPGHKVDRNLRDSYKVCIINYGNYLDAVNATKDKRGLKALSEDSKLSNDGRLFPDYSADLIEHPDKYCLVIPEDAENEVYCKQCKRIYIDKTGNPELKCPSCGYKMQSYEKFIDEVTIQ